MPWEIICTYVKNSRHKLNMKSTQFIFSIALITCVNCKKWDYENSVYCTGRLLHDVQTSELFENQRDFLNLKLKRSGHTVINRYKTLRHKIKIKEPEGRRALKDFIIKNFQNVTTLEPIKPIDWKTRFPLLKTINDFYTKDMLKRMNRNLLKFSRKMTKDVEENIEMYSYLPILRPFFIMNIDDNQMSYMDNLWLMEALLACDMVFSAKNLLLNLLDLVSEIGHVPPENRIYFVNRCSPPVLPLMLEMYFKKTKDVNFIKKYFKLIELDYLHWFKDRSQIVQNPFNKMMCINDERRRLLLPRPESYLEDMKYKKVKSDEIFNLVYWEIPPYSKISVKDNSITEWSARVLAEFSKHFGSYDNVILYQNISNVLVKTLDLLNIDDGWMDLDPDIGNVGPLSLWPVFTRSHDLKADVIPNPITPEEYVIGVRALLSQGKETEARDIALNWILLQRKQADKDLLHTCITILMIEHFPDIRLPPETENMKNELDPRCALFSFIALISYLYTAIEKTVLALY